MGQPRVQSANKKNWISLFFFFSLFFKFLITTEKVKHNFLIRKHCVTRSFQCFQQGQIRNHTWLIPHTEIKRPMTEYKGRVETGASLSCKLFDSLLKKKRLKKLF